MSAPRQQGVVPSTRRPGRASFHHLLIALTCLTAGYFVGHSSLLFEAHSSSSKIRCSTSGASRQPQQQHQQQQQQQQEQGEQAATATAILAVWGGDGSNSSSGSGNGSGTVTGDVKTVCEDSCAGHAGNGVCDDGRPGLKAEEGPAADTLAIFQVHCDLGTDCSDCGAWVHNNTDASDSWQPIEEIRAKEFAVFARRVVHPTAFVMAFTDPQQDVDVSLFMFNSGMLEASITRTWDLILREGCRGPNGEQRLVADVGGNFGYYSLLSASMGCRVVAWEPVPYFAAYFKYGLLRNNLTHAVQLREKIVSNSSGTELTIVVPNRGIWGTAGIGGKNLDSSIANEGGYDHITRSVERVDEVIHEDVLIMKIDVEGFEPSVLQGTKHLLLKHALHNIILEYSPGVAERAFDCVWFESNPRMLMGLLKGGYSVLQMPNLMNAPTSWDAKEALPLMEKVTQAVIRNDIEDAWRLQANTFGCHNAGAGLGQDAHRMFRCLSIPEGVHPQSLRSTFGHNTNIWAYKQKPWFATVGNDSILAPLDFDIQHEFFLPGGLMGAGLRPCASLEPDVQVMHRCPCSAPAVCGELAAKVKLLAGEGQLPPFPWEPSEGDSRQVDTEPLGIEDW